MVTVDGVEYDGDRSLAARILRPARPGLAAARAAVAGITDPREAWEALAARGIIPLEWVEDPRRDFESTEDAAGEPLGCALGSVKAGELVTVRFDRSGRRPRTLTGHHPAVSKRYRAAVAIRRGELVVEGPGPSVWPTSLLSASAWPATLGASLALAGDVAAVVTVEALAREYVGDSRRLARWRVVAGDALVVARTVARADTRGPGAASERRAVLELGYALDRITDDAIVIVAPVPAEVIEAGDDG